MREIWGIVAMGNDNSIGRNGDMPWHIPEDLKHFKSLTLGHPVIMGRRTWESLPKKPLPGRLNIIITSRPDTVASSDTVRCVASIDEALALTTPDSVPFIIGGGQIYRLAMPILSRLFITRIDTTTSDADTFFPAINPSEWLKVSIEGPFKSQTGSTYFFEEYERTDNK